MARLVSSSHNNGHNTRGSRYDSGGGLHAFVIVAVSSGAVAFVVAAANETRHAEATLTKPAQAGQSREGLTNGFGYFCDANHFPRGWPGLLTTGSGSGYSQSVSRPIAGQQGLGIGKVL